MTDFGSLANRTIKVIHNAETRRGKLDVPAGTTSTEAFCTIRTTVAALFETSVDGMVLKYTDEEGDLCTLSEGSMTDLVSISPTGVLRLVYEIRESGDESHAAASVAAEGSSGSPDDALRSTIRQLLQKIPAPMRGVALNMLQSMEACALQGMARMFMEQKVSHPDQVRAHLSNLGEDAEERIRELDQILPHLLDMDASALKALILEELQSLNVNAGMDVQGGTQQPNPMEALLGGLLGGKGMGKGADAPQGSVPGATVGQGEQMTNPMAQMLGAMLAAKGAGKGGAPWPGGLPAQNGYATPMGPQAPCTQCSAGHPLQRQLRHDAVCDICGKFGTSFRCSAGCDWDACDQCGAEAVPCPASTQAMLDSAEFHESVNDLVNMGLVEDPAVARELLAKHGDISTVVSILTEG